jgi:hypothetical protein
LRAYHQAMAPALMGPWRLPVLALALFAACAETETFEPRHPGDRCFEVCPEGMYCAAAGAGGSSGTAPRRCTLEPDRCRTQIDCHTRRARCVGASDVDVGYCDSDLPLGL